MPLLASTAWPSFGSSTWKSIILESNSSYIRFSNDCIYLEVKYGLCCGTVSYNMHALLICCLLPVDPVFSFHNILSNHQLCRLVVRVPKVHTIACKIIGRVGISEQLWRQNSPLWTGTANSCFTYHSLDDVGKFKTRSMHYPVSNCWMVVEIWLYVPWYWSHCTPESLYVQLILVRSIHFLRIMLIINSNKTMENIISGWFCSNHCSSRRLLLLRMKLLIALIQNNWPDIFHSKVILKMREQKWAL